MKKSINLILGLVLVVLLGNFSPVSNEVTIIRWTSNEYKDLETGDMISMTNEFACTQQGLSWSLYDGALPVSEVEWNLNVAEQGAIICHIASADLNGKVTFYLGATTRAVTDLNSDVGPLRFKFHFTKEQQIISNEESYASLSDGSNE